MWQEPKVHYLTPEGTYRCRPDNPANPKFPHSRDWEKVTCGSCWNLLGLQVINEVRAEVQPYEPSGWRERLDVSHPIPNLGQCARYGCLRVADRQHPQLQIPVCGSHVQNVSSRLASKRFDLLRWKSFATVQGGDGAQKRRVGSIVDAHRQSKRRMAPAWRVYEKPGEVVVKKEAS